MCDPDYYVLYFADQLVTQLDNVGRCFIFQQSNIV